MSQVITIVQLYPEQMNIYGDHGNLLVLKRRLEWYGYTPRVIEYNVGDTFPDDIDIVIGGGGQDSGQEAIHADLMNIGPKLKKLADDNTPMLMVCGLYQLFGNFFQTSQNKRLEGIGILDIETYGTDERLIGNIVTENESFGEIIGYENHSGQTRLGEGAEPFAKVVKGAGNNSEDGHEGARFRNVIGTYLHGSILPKNPQIADFMIEVAVRKRYDDFHPNVIDDLFVDLARRTAKDRPR
ncbi:glutamine amidotransferase [Candidatus Saccharibacteria bacterium]|nr:glutamine amidotransferase [Candidatus Saccharibacteria bacterium]MBQ68690.1 glutamine amidotransferase [Candidatus Saccharibacteria bacterium]|tara:strand:- start:128 stop:847 length:720 start_codon:yes stop_codon:yes gene_type:complete